MTDVANPGATFAGYRVESLVGRGGMGVVYRATDPSLDRAVALKLIAPELAEDSRLRARFLKEQRLAAALEHPNVVPVYEAGERDGQLFLAMRFIEGSDLKSAIRREGGLAPERSLSILAQIAGALDAAHRWRASRCRSRGSSRAPPGGSASASPAPSAPRCRA